MALSHTGSTGHRVRMYAIQVVQVIEYVYNAIQVVKVIEYTLPLQVEKVMKYACTLHR